jgi:hypothetical protein
MLESLEATRLSPSQRSQTQSLAGVMSRLVALTEAERAIFDGEIDDLSERVDSVPTPASTSRPRSGPRPGTRPARQAARSPL